MKGKSNQINVVGKEHRLPIEGHFDDEKENDKHLIKELTQMIKDMQLNYTHD